MEAGTAHLSPWNWMKCCLVKTKLIASNVMAVRPAPLNKMAAEMFVGQMHVAVI